MVFTAWEATSGGHQTYAFSLVGRASRANIQRVAGGGRSAGDVYRVRVRTREGELIPLRTVAEIRLVTAPSQVIRYNNLRSVTINGGPAPGYSSGQAIQAMESLAKRVLPPGYGFQWTGSAFQERAAAGPAGAVPRLALGF